MMPANANRDDWAGPLAALVASVRRDWDYPGVRAAISKARHRGTPLQIATALLRLAANTDLRTPAILADDGSHWGQPTTIPAARQPRCTKDGHEFELATNCRICRDDALAAGEAEPYAPVITPDQAARNTRWLATIRGDLDPRARAAGEREDD